MLNEIEKNILILFKYFYGEPFDANSENDFQKMCVMDFCFNDQIGLDRNRQYTYIRRDCIFPVVADVERDLKKKEQEIKDFYNSGHVLTVSRATADVIESIQRMGVQGRIRQYVLMWRDKGRLRYDKAVNVYKEMGFTAETAIWLYLSDFERVELGKY